MQLPFDPIWLTYPLLGMLAGLFAGLFGVGGGMTIVPLLSMLLQARGVASEHLMHLALGTAMASVVVTSLASLRAHHKRGAVRWDLVRQFTPGLVLGTAGGSMFATKVPTQTLSVIFVTVVYLAALQMILNLKPRAHRTVPRPSVVFASGLGIGIISSLVAAGGGFLSVPLMTFWNVPVHNAIGTSAAMGFPIALTGAVGYLWAGLKATNLPAHTLGYIELPAFFSVVAMSMFCAPLGARLAHRLPVATLKRLFGVFLMVIASRMLYSLLK